MKIAVVGAGGVGGYLGGLLAKEGHEVALIARGAHLEAIRERGIRVRSVHGDFEARPALATDRASEFGVADVVFFVVKTYDTDAAAEASRPLVGAATTVVPLQNGVESLERLSPWFGRERIVPGAVWIVTSIAEPGIVAQESQVRRFVVGEIDGGVTPRVAAIRDAIASTGCTAEVAPDITQLLWTKLLMLASIAGVTSVTRSTLGRILAVPEAKAMLHRAMAEVEAVARAKGIALEDAAAENWMRFAAKLEPTTTSSMARDVAAGRRSEYDALCGAVVRGGRENGVATPVHELCWTILRTLEPA
ncbi:MAG TPA: 2-dehydropantoate 2-reductase [Candidatus Polarisedimenticolaceae bacterium]|nr:2-dehydropantoate 2-reductase [Candidatus Polarisedimenticolaceae bacterium]